MKQNIKAFICALLAILMIISITACNNQPPVDTNATTGVTTEAPTETPTETPTEEPTEEPTETPTEEPTETPTEEPTTEEPSEEPTEEPTTEAPVEVIEEKPVRFDDSGNFVIMIFSDLRLSATVDQTIIDNMVKLVDEVKPGLVLFGGDMHNGSVKTEAELRTILDAVNAPLAERGIYWCNTFGVDSEGKGGSTTGFSREAQLEIYQTYEYCVTPDGAEGVYGVSNFVVPIRYPESNKVGFNLWCLDTNGYLNDYKDGMEKDVMVGSVLDMTSNLDTIHFSQIGWYWEKSLEFQANNNDRVVPGAMYFQVPARQLYYIRQSATSLKMEGYMMTTPTFSERESGIIWTCFERGDIKGIFSGYDAKNDFSGTYLGMTLGTCSSIGTGSDSFNAGARVIKLTRYGSRFSSEMAYLSKKNNDSAEADPLKPDILELTFDESGNASNAVGWPVLNAHGSMFAYDNSQVNRKVAILDGSCNFTIDALDVNGTLADGFSYELYFRVNEEFSSGYRGIFDYEEAGGFGLNAYKSDTAGCVDLHAEINLGGTYETIEYPGVDLLTRWVHVVFTYDGSTYSLYIDGELVGSQKSSKEIKIPSFGGGGTPFIGIGACAATNTTGTNHINGEIAICNLFSEGLTAEQVAELYAKNVTNYTGK